MTTGRVKVGLVEVGLRFAAARYLPYSTGLLQAYARVHAAEPDRLQFLEPVFQRTTVADACVRLADADVVGFSMYAWNTRVSLAVARALKLQRPQVLTVVGGPSVPDDATDFLAAHPYVDLVCHGEGEATFLAILEGLTQRAWSNLLSLSYRDGNRVVQTPRRERFADLSPVPSPYLLGVFDSLLARYTDWQWDALWETNRGCPYRCAYCSWGSKVQDRVVDMEMPRLEAEVEWFARHRIPFVFCCDANFGIRERDLAIAEMVAKAKEKWGFPEAFSVQNAKREVERCYGIQRVLSAAGLQRGVTLAMQSLNPPTLSSIHRRNIPTSAFRELQHRFTQAGVPTYTDLILGLPAETYESFADGVAQLIADGQHNRIQFINLAILPNAEMAEAQYQQRYGLVVVDTPIVNHHGPIADVEPEDTREHQALVVGTTTMPPAQWARARVFSWWASLLYFDKLLQVPLLLLHGQHGIGYRQLIEALAAAAGSPEFPMVARIHRFFEEQAAGIQAGGLEYYPSPHWLGVHWYQDEYVLLELLSGPDGSETGLYDLPALLQESRAVLDALLRRHGVLSEPLLDEAIRLNERLLKRPTAAATATLDLSADLWGYYRAVLCGGKPELAVGPCRAYVGGAAVACRDAQEWAAKVVWRGSKQGAYLHDVDRVEPLPPPPAAARAEAH
jgi:hypothetical protein